MPRKYSSMEVNVISREYTGEAYLRAGFYRNGLFSFLNPEDVIQQHPGSSQVHVKARKEPFRLNIPFQDCFLQAKEWTVNACYCEGLYLFIPEPLEIEVVPFNNDTRMEITCKPRSNFWAYVDTKYYLLEVRQQYGKEYAHLRAGF